MDIRANLNIDNENRVSSHWDYNVDTDEGCNDVIRQLLSEYGYTPTAFFKFARDKKRWESEYEDEVYNIGLGCAGLTTPCRNLLMGCWKEPFFRLRQGFTRELLLPQYKKLEKSVRTLKGYAQGMVASFVADDELTYGEGFADKNLQELLKEVNENIDNLKIYLLAEEEAKKPKNFGQY